MLSLTTIVPSLILLAGVVNDLKSQKVKNWLVLICAVVALVFTFISFGVTGLKGAGLSGLTAFIICLPFVYTKMLGAGDLKIFTAFAFSVSITTTINVFIYAFIWGALLGVIRAIIGGEAKQLLQNTLNIAGMKSEKVTQLHKIPYTVALFFGWMSYLTLSQLSGMQLW